MTKLRNVQALILTTLFFLAGSVAFGKDTKYYTDKFDINIFGCDLAEDADGRYGWYELEDFYITPGQDTEGKLYPKKILEIDKDGVFQIEVGHEGSELASNWWKSQISLNQIPDRQYPKTLHYALCGKLTLNVRGDIFGKSEPVKLFFDDFYINQGKDKNCFSQIAVKSFKSYSTYSIEGSAVINGNDYRIYIEQKEQGTQINIYIGRIDKSKCTWMKNIDGNRPVSTISMPGTHDSGSANYPKKSELLFHDGHTQNFPVLTQLEDGIRAFDIRLRHDLHYGHYIKLYDSFDSTMVQWDKFLDKYPSEFIVALIGSDEGGRWNKELTENYRRLISQYPHRFVEDFSPSAPIDSVRGKILVLRRQKACPYGRLITFADNATFDYKGFHVEDIYRPQNSKKKLNAVEKNIREASENKNPNKWFMTFNSIICGPGDHTPYNNAWGGTAKDIKRPMNKSLLEVLEQENYSNFGIVFLDFYNDRGENPKLVEAIINSNIQRKSE